jgi:hypothetical protein
MSNLLNFALEVVTLSCSCFHILESFFLLPLVGKLAFLKYETIPDT